MAFGDMKRLWIIIAACLLAGFSSSGALAKGAIYGTVTDGSTGEPLAFAAVGIPALNIGTTTDVNGTYRLI
ncbi:carboxypeptidase-like regulatory domain-containing protein, partial [Arthrospira platensis SPKY1]|nr:carboxypeptidase-like regulatory domain-containing protein [Arthrospira platensis SPKY1]